MPASPNSDAIPRQDLETVMDFDLEMQRLNHFGTRIMPVFKTRARTARFGRIPIEQLLAASSTDKLERAAKTGYSRDDWTFEMDSFITQVRGCEAEIDDDERAIYGELFDAELVAVARCYEKLFSKYDDLVLAQAITATITAGYTAEADSAWDLANATPRDDIKAARRRMWLRTGMSPNTMVISEWTFENLKDTTQVIDRMSSSGSGEPTLPSDITEAKLAEIFSVDEVIVAKSVKYDSGVESQFPEDKALLIRTPRTNDLREPCFGRTFAYEGIHGNFQPTPFTYREEKIECDIVRLKHESTQKIMYPEMAEVITGLVTEE